MDATRDDGISEFRLLTSFDEVIAELGGVVKVSRLTKRSKSAVCNWRNTGRRFPANQYKQIRDALRECGCLVDMNLFTFLGRTPPTPIVDVAA